MRKTILFCLTGVMMILVFIPNILKATDNLMSDAKEHSPEKQLIKNTRELNGTVINTEDKSYKKNNQCFYLLVEEKKKLKNTSSK